MPNTSKVFSSLNTWMMVYLSFPCLVFIFFWVRTPYSLMLIALLLYVLYMNIRDRVDGYAENFISHISARNLGVVLTLVTFLTVISGAGGYVVQRGDWTKHNVIINDLINYDWPVNYGAGPYVSDTTLVYYLAYYIPPAIVGKLLGNWQSAEIATFIYTFIGILLFALGVLRFNKNKVWYLLVLFGISGIDVVGNILVGKIPISLTHLESYAPGLQIPSFISQLTWAPQHTISAWLFAYLVYADITSKRLANSLLFYVGISLLWSPFVSASILLAGIPFLWPLKINTRVILTNFAGLITGLVVLLYFKSQINILNDAPSLYWYSSDTLSSIIYPMIVFILVDILLFIPFVELIRKGLDKQGQKVFIWSITILILVAQFRFGAVNDWLLRTTPLIVIMISLTIIKNADQYQKLNLVSKILCITIFIVGIITPISQVAILSGVSNPSTNQQPDRNMLTAHLKYGVIHQQYMGSASRLFGKLIGNYATSNK